MKIQQNAVNILERTSAYLKAGVITKPPLWYDVVAQIPPRKKFIREPKLSHPVTNRSRMEHLSNLHQLKSNGLFKTRYGQDDKRIDAKKLYKAPKIKLLEDDIRQLFYDQHPWERSRPMMLIENTSIDLECDWSHIQQLGRPLNGESVVQRTLYLLERNRNRTMLDAYDQARFEFYRIRMQQEMEENVALEEAEMLGSVFGKDSIEHNLNKEQQVIDNWKENVIMQDEVITSRRAAPSQSWDDTDDATNKTSDPQDTAMESLRDSKDEL